MKAVMYFENGVMLEANSFGAEGTICGEAVFNTSLSGYQEICTDPSYAGQFVLFTAPEIGVVGVNDEDCESGEVFASGVIVLHYSEEFSNFRAQNSLSQLLKKYGKMGLCDVDTRFLTKMLRENGAMQMVASTEIFDEKELAKILASGGKIYETNWVEKVSTKEAYGFDSAAWDQEKLCFKSLKPCGKKVAVIDYGVKKNILRELCDVGLDLIVVPHDTKAETLIEMVKKGEIDGVFLSNGPGEPRMLKFEIEQIKKLIDADVKMFGICLGHQLLSNAFGFETYKLKFGQHGANHPVQNLISKQIEITTQNHNYNVPEGIAQVAEVTHRNLFDGTIEGVAYNNKPIFSVQHHPEASGGPRESRYIFKQFVELLQRD